MLSPPYITIDKRGSTMSEICIPQNITINMTISHTSLTTSPYYGYVP